MKYLIIVLALLVTGCGTLNEGATTTPGDQIVANEPTDPWGIPEGLQPTE